MGKTVIMDHPLIQHKIGLIRNIDTGSKDFRELVGEIATLECYEATRNLELEEYPVETPMGHTIAKRLAGKKLAIIPILRAGLGMVPGMQTLLPAAKVGHIGLYRDPATMLPVEYYCKLPGKNIRFLCIIAAPEGLKKLQDAEPDVDIYVGALDDHLNDIGYIVPGLGDAGDRIFGTK